MRIEKIKEEYALIMENQEDQDRIFALFNHVMICDALELNFDVVDKKLPVCTENSEAWVDVLAKCFDDYREI